MFVRVVNNVLFCIFLPWRKSPKWAKASSLSRIHDDTQTKHTLGRTPLDGWSARRGVLYLTTHNTHKRQNSMPPGRIRTHNPSKWAAVDPRLRPRGHWDRRSILNDLQKYRTNGVPNRALRYCGIEFFVTHRTSTEPRKRGRIIFLNILLNLTL